MVKFVKADAAKRPPGASAASDHKLPWGLLPVALNSYVKLKYGPVCIFAFTWIALKYFPAPLYQKVQALLGL